ncbi:putative LOB domain-containing protein [Tripterygium wilfordii]|uniref:Putative LOB domain-containing protein n=1 Tax=Tripterygium wilfordii TaxID=458696 RepID=A0A7J7E1W3_TRIWF|nr:LOB domain-containing protein 21-like [Tripterygium wilfordii]KAF5752585.1 putative LOB domain-containing protein [Tripterygium wilfordii]
MRGQESRSSSSCAACKLLKRRCSPDCIFAPHFPSNDPLKFAIVHKVFGASNVSKILIEVPIELREDAVNTLAFEADARLKDPVYGCFGAVVLLQRKMTELQHDLAIVRSRIAQFAAASSSAAAAAQSFTDFGHSSQSYCQGPLDHEPIGEFSQYL